MKRLILSLALWVGFLGFASSQTPEEAFDLYQEGKYLDAAAKYEALINNELPSSDLYFNLGTCYLAAHDIAHARLALERALLLNPGSRSIQQQLNRLSRSIEPNIEPLPSFFLLEYFFNLRDLLNKNSWGWLFLIFSSSFAVFGMILPSPRRKALLLFIGFITFFLCLLFVARNRHEQTPASILMDAQPLRIAPEISSQQLIFLGVGTKAQPVDSLGEWYKVVLDNNDIGWLPKANLTKI